MTEDIVNEICKVCTEALGSKFNKFVVAVGIRGVEDGENGFYPHGDTILVSDLKSQRLHSQPRRCRGSGYGVYHRCLRKGRYMRIWRI